MTLLDTFTGSTKAYAVPTGMAWLAIGLAGAVVMFWPGLQTLFVAWQSPEYSHGPLIPVLSAVLFLRHLRDMPGVAQPVTDRWIGTATILAALGLGALGWLANIGDLAAYALILWIAGLVLTVFGWRTGRKFWPSILHLVFMLPLPGVIYFKMTTGLQFLSSEMGVALLRGLSVPVYLEGNIIDLGVVKLHVAEACSGLRYLFPILSFSYIFALLYQGPAWHKAVLLLSAAPITIAMNAARIALAGVIVNHHGPAWVEGGTHFFEGWVVFLACVAALFALARALLWLHPARPRLADALDLDVSGSGRHLWRIWRLEASPALVCGMLATLAVGMSVVALPPRGAEPVSRLPFALFPDRIGDWSQAGPVRQLPPAVSRALGADDYLSVFFSHTSGAAPVDVFVAWYADQSAGGVHSPEICLPGAGWEIAWLDRTDVAPIAGTETPFQINRAIIQRGTSRQMVYYWFDQKGRRIAWDFAAKYWLLVDAVRTGRSDGALVRLTTPIDPGEPDNRAEARLQDMLRALQGTLPRFIGSGLTPD
ncbi:MAG: VPLPA-CTERM-specific exosortase XrtD [Pseudomonadota bacterium]